MTDSISSSCALSNISSFVIYGHTFFIHIHNHISKAHKLYLFTVQSLCLGSIECKDKCSSILTISFIIPNLLLLLNNTTSVNVQKYRFIIKVLSKITRQRSSRMCVKTIRHRNRIRFVKTNVSLILTRDYNAHRSLVFDRRLGFFVRLLYISLVKRTAHLVKRTVEQVQFRFMSVFLVSPFAKEIVSLADMETLPRYSRKKIIV